MTKSMKAATWVPCRFTFSTGETWDLWEGETDGSTWNGFDNVRVRPDVHAKITAAFADGGDAEDGTAAVPCVDGWHDYSNGFVTRVQVEGDFDGGEFPKND